MDATSLKVSSREGELWVDVHVKPRAGRSEVRGVREGALEVAVAAPPVDGAANQELVRVLARRLDLPRSAVRLVRGEGSRRKVVALSDLDEAELLRRLARG